MSTTEPPPGGWNTLRPPPRLWWEKVGPDERVWLTVAFVWCLVMFTAMVLWQGRGDQRIPVESYRIEETEYFDEAQAFIDAHQVGVEEGIPLVEPPPGEDVYLHASQFQFRPVLRLQRGETYRFLISSTDVQHGVSLQKLGRSYNFQVLPGYLYVVKLTPQDVGEFSIVCNEFCGEGHHTMTGRIHVVE